MLKLDNDAKLSLSLDEASLKKRRLIKLCTSGVLLILIGLYVLFVAIPIHNKVVDLENKKYQTEERLKAHNKKSMRYAEMKEELEKVKLSSSGELAIIPDYDNIDNLLLDFNNIFYGLEPKVSFVQPVQEGDLVKRVIQFRVTMNSYSAAKRVLSDLNDIRYKSILDNIVVEPADKDGLKSGRVTISGKIQFYELGVLKADEEEEGRE